MLKIIFNIPNRREPVLARKVWTLGKTLLWEVNGRVDNELQENVDSVSLDRKDEHKSLIPSSSTHEVFKQLANQM
jgi:hypothetical protein